ncbi:MAG: CRISPR-associated protein Cas4 [Nitrososphaerota archaeon]
MSEEEELLSVVLVRQFHFCRQIPYINLVLHVVEPETESMQYSFERHQSFKAQYLPRSLKPRRVLTDVRLKSSRLGLAGRLDALVETVFGELIPCELKHSALRGRRPVLKDVAQLAAYAMLVEECFGSVVKRGVIYYAENGAKPVVNIMQSHRDLVKTAINAIREMVSLEEPPSQRNTRECAGCWYRRVCWP